MVLIHVGAEIQWVMPPVDVVTWCDDPTSTGKEIWVCIIAYSRILAIVLTAVMRYVNRWSFPRNMQVRARTSFASSQHHATTSISSVDDGVRNSFTTTVKSFQRIVVLNSQLGIESDTVLDRGAAVKVPFPFVGCCSVMALWFTVGLGAAFR